MAKSTSVIVTPRRFVATIGSAMRSITRSSRFHRCGVVEGGGGGGGGGSDVAILALRPAPTKVTPQWWTTWLCFRG